MVFLNGSTKPVVGWKWTRCLELSRMKYLLKYRGDKYVTRAAWS